MSMIEVSVIAIAGGFLAFIIMQHKKYKRQSQNLDEAGKSLKAVYKRNKILSKFGLHETKKFQVATEFYKIIDYLNKARSI